MITKYFSDKIQTLKQQNLYRKPTPTSFIAENIVSIGESKNNFTAISFASNDYLGLANHKKVKKAAIKAIKKYGTSSKSSRYIAGNNKIYQKIEEKLSKIFKKEDAIVFSSGYQAAIGVIPALIQKNDLVIADKLIHSCLIDGVKLSGAKLLRYNHNDLSHLQKILKENEEKYSKILIITESIFSMDGDLAPLDKIQKIAKKNKALLLIDCAHSLYEKRQNIEEDFRDDNCGAKNYFKTKYSKRFFRSLILSSVNVFKLHAQHKNEKRQNIEEDFGDETIFLGTFSKALGSFGGYIVGSKITIDYLRNFAKSAIYTTALPPATLAANLEALKIVSKKKLAKKTLENTKYLCELLNIEFQNSAIIIIEIDDVKKTLQIVENLKQQGFFISAIRPPTSPTARLRITINAKHKKKEIEKLVEKLSPLLPL